MILADKIIYLRKKNDWSQEELAEKMNVSRQAVSKWESAQSLPDTDKILQMSRLCGVTTDFLMKDEIEAEEYSSDGDNNGRVVSLEEANTYLSVRKADSKRIALATVLCILSPCCLLILAGLSQDPRYGISETAAAGVGLVVLLLIVAAAVGMYVYTGFQSAPFRYLEEEEFEAGFGVTGIVREQWTAFRPRYALMNIMGTCLCVLSPLPIFLGVFLGDPVFTVVAVAFLLLMVAAGVFFFISAGVRNASMERLLQEGEWSRAKKSQNRLTDTVASIYWPLMVAVYLAWSFLTGRWDITWVVWPVAGVLFAAVAGICQLFSGEDAGK